MCLIEQNFHKHKQLMCLDMENTWIVSFVLMNICVKFAGKFLYFGDFFEEKQLLMHFPLTSPSLFQQIISSELM